LAIAATWPEEAGAGGGTASLDSISGFVVGSFVGSSVAVGSGVADGSVVAVAVGGTAVGVAVGGIGVAVGLGVLVGGTWVVAVGGGSVKVGLGVIVLVAIGA